MSHRHPLTDLALLAGVAILYAASATAGLQLAYVNGAVTPVWPPTGIALAAVMLLGTRAWPAVFLGAFAAAVITTGLSPMPALMIGIGNVLEAIVGAVLVKRFAGGVHAFERIRTVFVFALVTTLIATPISATIGVGALILAGTLTAAATPHVWMTWWLGDASAALLVTPVLVLWVTTRNSRWTMARAGEALTLALSIVAIGLVSFTGAARYPLIFLCFPILSWSAFRFSPREASTAMAAFAGVAVWGAVHDVGPFVLADRHSSLLMLQSFMAVTAVLTLATAAVMREHTRIEAELHKLAITDSLTGLSNHRQLVNSLRAVVDASLNSGGTFAMLFLDVNNLKTINDRDGHLVGNRVLCRVATALRASCRPTDTIARYGGDEFAVVLPGASATDAIAIGRRIVEYLNRDPEPPGTSVSLGVSAYPESGKTPEQLLEQAERAMYLGETSDSVH